MLRAWGRGKGEGEGIEMAVQMVDGRLWFVIWSPVLGVCYL